MKFNRDCRSFLGNYACEIMTAEGLKDCTDCKFYEKISKKILIIKLGAMGDVLRTTPILPALRKKYSSNIHLTWLVNPESLPLLEKNSYIDKILICSPETLLRLRHEKFSILINLDIDSKATLIANEVQAEAKFGYYFDSDGHPSPFNKSANYYLARVFSNHVNKNNTQTYQEMMFEIAELPYNKEELILKNIDEDYGKNFQAKYHLTENDKIIGINIGSAGRWVSKAWHPDNIKTLINQLPNYKIILLGGPNEKNLLPQFISENILTNDLNNSLPQFISVLNLCDIIITGDTLALHLATALKKKTLALFFCTPPQEIETYGLVKKITSPLLDKYFYSDLYHEDLVKSISPEQVLKELKEIKKIKNG